jgi:polysaccharide pyruvyl transferase WcaK-like protein
LDALEVPSVQVQDIVFLHSPPRIPSPPTKEKRIGISVRGGFLGDNENVIPVIYDYLVSEGFVPIFLVHSTAGDEEQNDALFIRRVMAGKTYNITKTIQQTLDVYPFLHAVIGMRFHAGVLACIHEIPCIMISYGPKSLELAQELEIPHLVINPNELSFDIFQNMWHTCMDNYDREKRNMVSKHAFIRQNLIHSLESL